VTIGAIPLFEGSINIQIFIDLIKLLGGFCAKDFRFSVSEI